MIHILINQLFIFQLTYKRQNLCVSAASFQRFSGGQVCQVFQDADDVTQSSFQTSYSQTGGSNLAARGHPQLSISWSLTPDLYGSAIGSTSTARTTAVFWRQISTAAP